MRESLQKSALQNILLEAVAEHPDCRTIRLLGGVFFKPRQEPDDPTWDFACRFKASAGLHNDAHLGEVIRAIVTKLQGQYDLEPPP